jgi:predicted RNA-binding Zn-ribbon protein involved in translation (DUF1610 family)
LEAGPGRARTPWSQRTDDRILQLEKITNPSRYSDRLLAYVVLVGVLLWRMERRLRSVRPVCPHCGIALKGMSERVASATGKCDSCGGWILKQEDR